MYDLAAGVTKMSFGELMQGNTTDVSYPLKLKLDFHALFPSLTMKTGRRALTLNPSVGKTNLQIVAQRKLKISKLISTVLPSKQLFFICAASSSSIYDYRYSCVTFEV